MRLRRWVASVVEVAVDVVSVAVAVVAVVVASAAEDALAPTRTASVATPDGKRSVVVQAIT